MIPVVEDYLVELIEGKLKLLRENPEQISRILGMGLDRMYKVQEYVSRTPIRVIKGYPRTPAELPSICIMLSKETEEQEGLGDYDVLEGHDTYPDAATDTVLVIDTLGGKIEVPYIELPRKALGVISKVTHIPTGVELYPAEYSVIDYDRSIISLESDLCHHGDPIEVTYTHGASTEAGIRVLYDANYRIEVWTTNGDLTVEIYHLVKWILLAGRDHLGRDKGIYRQKLGGSDFEPVTGYFPEFVYRRSVTYWCQFSAFVPTDIAWHIDTVHTKALPLNSHKIKPGGVTFD